MLSDLWDAADELSAIECAYPPTGADLTHRDLLGGLMGIGLTRERVGDILVGESAAQIVCLRMSRLPALRRLAGALDGTESFLRTALGLEVFAERGLVTLECREDMMIVRPRPGCRADLEQSAYVRRLRRILGQDEKGAK